MRRTLSALVIASLAVSLTGCGAGHNAATRQVRQVTDGVEASITKDGNDIKVVNLLVVAAPGGNAVLVETVVYPHHGAALIEAIETRVIKGEEKTYLVLKVAQGDLTVRVPADNVDLVGVRDVVDSAGLDRVFSVLRQPYTEEPTNWSRRYKANLEKLASGDVIKVAEVVRDLYRRDLDRGLSAGEKRMLAKAKQLLVSELALAELTDKEKAAVILQLLQIRVRSK